MELVLMSNTFKFKDVIVEDLKDVFEILNKEKLEYNAKERRSGFSDFTLTDNSLNIIYRAIYTEEIMSLDDNGKITIKKYYQPKDAQVVIFKDFAIMTGNPDVMKLMKHAIIFNSGIIIEDKRRKTGYELELIAERMNNIKSLDFGKIENSELKNLKIKGKFETMQDVSKIVEIQPSFLKSVQGSVSTISEGKMVDRVIKITDDNKIMVSKPSTEYYFEDFFIDIHDFIYKK